MKFIVEDSKDFCKALEDIQGKGKYLGLSSLTNSKVGSEFFMELKDNNLELWNGDSTFALNISYSVNGETDGSFTGDSDKLISYMKKFEGECTIEVGDSLQITCGSKKATTPCLVNHANISAIQRIKEMTSHVKFEAIPETLWNFASKKFEGCFQLPSESFSNCMGLCELVKTGVYKLDYKGNDDDGKLELSSRDSISNSYVEEMQPLHSLGEPATLEYSGPLHKFFNKTIVNFYVRDEFPLMLVGHDRKLIKAPYTRGE